MQLAVNHHIWGSSYHVGVTFAVVEVQVAVRVYQYPPLEAGPCLQGPNQEIVVEGVWHLPM